MGFCSNPFLSRTGFAKEFPPGWAEWNDKFRDDVRGFWKGDRAAAALTKRLCASTAIFNHQSQSAFAAGYLMWEV